MNKQEILLILSDDKNFTLENGKYKYIGGWGGRTHKSLPKIVLSALRAFSNQGTRCNNKKAHNYKNYGGNGVKREWDFNTCCNWYINELLTRETWKVPCVSRIGDVGNYNVDNCKLIEFVENCKEVKISDNVRRSCSNVGKNVSRETRIKNLEKASKVRRRKPVELIDEKTNEVLNFISVDEASKFMGIDSHSFNYYIKKQKIVLGEKTFIIRRKDYVRFSV